MNVSSSVSSVEAIAEDIACVPMLPASNNGQNSGITIRRNIIDCSKKTEPRSLMYRECVGSCHAYVTLRQDWKEATTRVLKAVPFAQCRFHGIFNDWMGVCSRDVNGKLLTNFINVDKVYQGILDLGMKPFVELGFMPKALASGDQTCFHYQANVTPPNDYEEWRQFIRTFVEHLIERFGHSEVVTWRFEVWNEPDLPYFWKDADQDEYFKLYEMTAREIKSIHPAIRVGGPATSKNAWVKDMLDFCKRVDAPLDFISTHHYCSDSALEIGEVSDEIQYFGQGKMVRDVSWVRQIIDDSAFPDAELHYTEWNISPAHNDRFGKDSEFTMTFVLQTLKDLGNIADSYSYWTINDIFEESGPGVGPFSGKYGLVSIHGVPKPAFHAYAFIDCLYDQVIPDDASSCIVTTNGKHFRVLSWNHCEPSECDYNGGEWTIQKARFEDCISLQGLNGYYRVRAWLVDRTHGNSYRAWQQMGEPEYLSVEQVEELHRASEPALLKDAILYANSTLDLRHKLTENSLLYYEVESLSRGIAG